MPSNAPVRALLASTMGIVLAFSSGAARADDRAADSLVSDIGLAGSSAGVWVDAHEAVPGRYASLEVGAKDALPFDSVVEIQGMVHSRVFQSKATIHLEAVNEGQQVIHESEVSLPLAVGANPFTFAFEPDALPAGQHEVRLRLTVNDYQLLAEGGAVIRKLDGRELSRHAELLTTRLASLQDHLDNHAGPHAFPYERMRLAATERLLPASVRMLGNHDLLQADEILRYVESTQDSVRAAMTFGDLAAREATAAPQPDMGTVEVRDGGFYAGDTPVFLFGFAGGQQMVDELGLLSRLGLNLAVVTHGPGHTDAQGKPLTTADRLRPVIQAAAKHNVAVSVQLSLAPAFNFPAAAQTVPAIRTTWPVEPNAIVPEEPHWFMAGALRWLASQPIVHSAGIANRPEIRLQGEDARRAFIQYLEGAYPTRYDLNRSWKMRLRDLDEVAILPESDRIAYQHDWQSFSRAAGAQYSRRYIEQLSAVAPGLPMYLKYDSAVHGADGQGPNMDYEALASVLPITGATTRLSRTHERYALDYPGHVLPYVALRSMVPDSPLLDTELHVELPLDEALMGEASEAFVHAGLWDAAIEGLNGAALWSWSQDPLRVADGHGLMEHLGALEGLARASLDLNRLAPIVVALQQTEADVAILYSYEALIRSDADEYIDSVEAAFEGISFGGRKVRLITERQAASGELSTVRVLVLPKVRALTDEAFQAVSDYIENGGIVIRTPNQILHDGRGHSRQQVLMSTLQTVLVRGLDSPQSYFHAMEAAYATGGLPEVPRPSNEYGYLLQGVKSRFVEVDGQGYLYLVNLRKEPVRCGLHGPLQAGFDLIQGRTVTFPALLEPLDPMLIRLDRAETNRVVIADQVQAP